MSTLKDEITEIVTSKTFESFDFLPTDEKQYLATLALKDYDNFDPADVLLYRNDSFQKALQLFRNKKITGEQLGNKIFDILINGFKQTIDELIDEKKSEIFNHVGLTQRLNCAEVV